VIFSLQIDSFGTYYFVDANGSRKLNTFYYFTLSGLVKTLFGQIILSFCFFFLNVTLSIVVGVTLNVVSLIKYKSYIRNRRHKNETSLNNVAHSSNVFEAKSKLTLKEASENKAEKNMLYMALTLCTIMIQSRILVCFIGVYNYLFDSFSVFILLIILDTYVYTLVPTLAIFVFYFFNKMFRSEFKKKFNSKTNDILVPDSNLAKRV
jgi:hypothetical protein